MNTIIFNNGVFLKLVCIAVYFVSVFFYCATLCSNCNTLYLVRNTSQYYAVKTQQLAKCSVSSKEVNEPLPDTSLTSVLFDRGYPDDYFIVPGSLLVSIGTTATCERSDVEESEEVEPSVTTL